MLDNFTDEALDGILNRARRRHNIEIEPPPVRIGEVIPQVIAEIHRRRNKRVQTRISGANQRGRRRQYGRAR